MWPDVLQSPLKAVGKLLGGYLGKLFRPVQEQFFNPLKC